MIKKYIVPPLHGLQVGDLVRYVNPHKNIYSEREGSLGVIYASNTETNSNFDYDQQRVISHDYTVYSVYWQKEIPGWPSDSVETDKYLKLVWSSSDITELASRLGMTEIESEVAGSINYKYGE
jgi:hypothetical protein